MKLLYKKIALPEGKAYCVEEITAPCYEDSMHYHPEFEIIYVFKGSGTKIIGENIASFSPGDLAIIGPDIPHAWRNDNNYNKADTNIIEIHFTPDFLGNDFFTKPEMKPILQLFNKAAQGLNIYGMANPVIAQKMKQMLATNDEFVRILIILEILECAANTNDVTKLCRTTYTSKEVLMDSQRINKITNYINKKFQEDITLDEVAEIACLSISAFCKYFKKHTNKTFSAFLNETRIGYACKLLIENNYPISQVCFESGFKSITNFNRQFKSQTDIAPYEYRQYYKRKFFQTSIPA